MSLPSVRDIFRALEKVREAFKKTKSVHEALRYAPTSHEGLRVIAEEKLRLMGYKIVPRDEAPEWIKKIGSPDIVAVKGDEWIIAEVKPFPQLRRYAQSRAKVILVTDVDDGRRVEIWGIRQLENP